MRLLQLPEQFHDMNPESNTPPAAQLTCITMTKLTVAAAVALEIPHENKDFEKWRKRSSSKSLNWVKVMSVNLHQNDPRFEIMRSEHQAGPSFRICVFGVHT